MHGYQSFSKEGLKELDKIYRLNLINSISGFKPANLIGTVDKEGKTNLAIFSSIVHLGSNPALLGFIMRPRTVERHSYDNIMSEGHYTINHVSQLITDKAHYTSAKFPVDQSEFDTCGLSAEYVPGFSVPLVKESKVKMVMKFEQEIPISINDTIMIIGSVQQLYVVDHAIEDDGALNLEAAQCAAISGLNTYYSSNRLAKYPYARVGEPSKNQIAQ